MNEYVIIILIILASIGVLYLLLKNNKVRTLNKALQQKDTNRVRSILASKVTSVFLSTYVRDLYEAKTYLLDKDDEMLKTSLRRMFVKSYELNEDKEYLTLYYHLYVQRRDLDFIDELLQRIEQHRDASFIQYCKWTKAVLIDGRNDLISDMEAAIDDKQYTVFPLGVVVYLIGVQANRLEHEKDALEWLETALEVLRPNGFYYQSAKDEVTILRQRKKERDAEV